MQDAPLTGLRVVDLSTTLMGPYCSRLLAALGADVIKVEAPGGDVVRYVGDSKKTGMGPVYLSCNHGKRSLAIDLKKPEGLEALRRLTKTADVFMHNMRPGAVKGLGLGAAELRADHPRLVYCALPGFGEGGPYRDRAAYDDVIQAGSGVASVQGGRGDPMYVRTVIADKVVGVMAHGAILAALVRRGVTGVGGAVEVPMFEATAAFITLEQQGGMIFDPPRGPSGYSRTDSPWRRPYKTKDGFLGVLVYTDKQWLSFFDLIGKSELASDPRFRTIKERTENIDHLYELVDQTLPSRTTEEWRIALGKLGIACAPVQTLADLFEDPHLQAVKFWERIDHPSEGGLRLPRSPVLFADTIPPTLRPAPRLGENSRELLAEAGLTSDAIEDLIRKQIVIAPPP